MASTSEKLRRTLAGADVGKSLTSSTDEVADLLTGTPEPSTPAEEALEPDKEEPAATTEASEAPPEPSGPPSETPPEDESRGEANAEASPAGTATDEETTGAEPASAAPASSGSQSRRSESGSARRSRKSTGKKDKDASPSDEAATGLTSQYLGDSLYRLPSGAVGARPTFYLREDQMTALRTSVSARVDFFGRTITEAAQCIFDLMGYNAASVPLPFGDVPADVPVYEPLLTRRQWEMLLDKAEALCEEQRDGEEVTPMDLMRAVSWLIQDALYDKGFGDGRSRKKKFKL